jgi:hypothetical protein
VKERRSLSWSTRTRELALSLLSTDPNTQVRQILEHSALCSHGAVHNAGDWVQIEGKRLRHGKGTFIDGKDSFEGEWVMDAIEGTGTYNFSSGAVFQGSWKNNMMCGEGMYKWTDKASYTGNWRDSK